MARFGWDAQRRDGGVFRVPMMRRGAFQETTVGETDGVFDVVVVGWKVKVSHLVPDGTQPRGGRATPAWRAIYDAVLSGVATGGRADCLPIDAS